LILDNRKKPDREPDKNLIRIRGGKGEKDRYNTFRDCTEYAEEMHGEL
jgi:hypothetical protein